MKALILLAAWSYNCGIPPIPPIGCHMQCVCDQDGDNCQYIAVCP